MYLEIFLADFAVFCVFLGISRDFAEIPEFRGSATARNIRSPESWCHWVAIDVRIRWRGLFYMMHYLKVCFHMTYPFLKGWDITLDFSLALLSHENPHSFIPSNGMEILFSRIDSSSHTAVSCDLASYCLCLYTVLYLLIYFLVLASFFFY